MLYNEHTPPTSVFELLSFLPRGNQYFNQYFIDSLLENVILLKQTSIYSSFPFLSTSLVAQRVKRLPAMQETQVRSLGREDPLEKEMATHSSTLAWKIPWAEK